ncbi:MAG TPA: hypothetical protein VFS02_04130 [Telluria sp.]|nr:hypothetical protein [Telluria sp.]
MLRGYFLLIRWRPTAQLKPQIKTMLKYGAVRTEEDPSGLPSALVTYAARAAGTWSIWIRPRKERPNKRQ